MGGKDRDDDPGKGSSKRGPDTKSGTKRFSFHGRDRDRSIFNSSWRRTEESSATVPEAPAGKMGWKMKSAKRAQEAIQQEQKKSKEEEEAEERGPWTEVRYGSKGRAGLKPDNKGNPTERKQEPPRQLHTRKSAPVLPVRQPKNPDTPARQHDKNNQHQTRATSPKRSRRQSITLRVRENSDRLRDGISTWWRKTSPPNTKEEGRGRHTSVPQKPTATSRPRSTSNAPSTPVALTPALTMSTLAPTPVPSMPSTPKDKWAGVNRRRSRIIKKSKKTDSGESETSVVNQLPEIAPMSDMDWPAMLEQVSLEEMHSRVSLDSIGPSSNPSYANVLETAVERERRIQEEKKREEERIEAQIKQMELTVRGKARKDERERLLQEEKERTEAKRKLEEMDQAQAQKLVLKRSLRLVRMPPPAFDPTAADMEHGEGGSKASESEINLTQEADASNENAKPLGEEHEPSTDVTNKCPKDGKVIEKSGEPLNLDTGPPRYTKRPEPTRKAIHVQSGNNRLTQNSQPSVAAEDPFLSSMKHTEDTNDDDDEELCLDVLAQSSRRAWSRSSRVSALWRGTSEDQEVSEAALNHIYRQRMRNSDFDEESQDGGRGNHNDEGALELEEEQQYEHIEHIALEGRGEALPPMEESRNDYNSEESEMAIIRRRNKAITDKYPDCLGVQISWPEELYKAYRHQLPQSMAGIFRLYKYNARTLYTKLKKILNPDEVFHFDRWDRASFERRVWIGMLTDLIGFDMEKFEHILLLEQDSCMRTWKIEPAQYLTIEPYKDQVLHRIISEPMLIRKEGGMPDNWVARYLGWRRARCECQQYSKGL